MDQATERGDPPRCYRGLGAREVGLDVEVAALDVGMGGPQLGLAFLVGLRGTDDRRR